MAAANGDPVAGSGGAGGGVKPFEKTGWEGGTGVCGDDGENPRSPNICVVGSEGADSISVFWNSAPDGGGVERLPVTGGGVVLTGGG
ncbi:MAG: hypothetical protein PHX83_02270 [Acidobacteriia bacterium]|nr:hypothetical protein [Terriglobia bacterium]